MLPSEPKIFYGRESELLNILKLFSQQEPRIAILGAGGMGKTSLARAVLHHTSVMAKYGQHRYFVACDTAATKIELAAIIGAHLGLKPGKDLTHAVVQRFSRSPPCLLILDNLETLWEPTELRNEIEAFLSLLTDVEHLALMVRAHPLLLPSTNIIISDYHARSRTTSPSAMDSALCAAFEATRAKCC
jgi:GTPase SAR1 family protein